MLKNEKFLSFLPLIGGPLIILTTLIGHPIVSLGLYYVFMHVPLTKTNIANTKWDDRTLKQKIYILYFIVCAIIFIFVFAMHLFQTGFFSL